MRGNAGNSAWDSRIPPLRGAGDVGFRVGKVESAKWKKKILTKLKCKNLLDLIFRFPFSVFRLIGLDGHKSEEAKIAAEGRFPRSYSIEVS